MLNRVILMGRITQDLDLRTTSGGTSVLTFNVAVDRGYVKQGEERQSDFITCVAWRQQAEFINRYFAKGRMMGVVGSLQTGRYEKDGQTHYTTDVLVDEAYFADSKSSSDTSTSAPIQNTTADFGADAGLMPIPADDDLPF